MNDFLNLLEPYKNIKEIADLIDEIQKLREYYYTQNYEKMQQHINNISNKYLVESAVWNTFHPVKVFTPEEQYSIAEEFLFRVSIEMLCKYNVNIFQDLPRH